MRIGLTQFVGPIINSGAIYTVKRVNQAFDTVSLPPHLPASSHFDPTQYCAYFADQYRFHFCRNLPV